MYQIDMKFDMQLRPATETSWVVSYGGKTIPTWRRAAIFKIDISPYRSEKSSDFDEILYTAADFELDKRHVIKNENFQNLTWRTAAILKIDISPYLSEQEAQLSLTNRAMLICKVVEVWQDFLSEYVHVRMLQTVN